MIAFEEILKPFSLKLDVFWQGIADDMDLREKTLQRKLKIIEDN